MIICLVLNQIRVGIHGLAGPHAAVVVVVEAEEGPELATILVTNQQVVLALDPNHLNAMLNVVVSIICVKFLCLGECKKIRM